MKKFPLFFLFFSITELLLLYITNRLLYGMMMMKNGSHIPHTHLNLHPHLQHQPTQPTLICHQIGDSSISISSISGRNSSSRGLRCVSSPWYVIFLMYVFCFVFVFYYTNKYLGSLHLQMAWVMKDVARDKQVTPLAGPPSQ
jgi:hypothetical protein